MSGKPAIHAMAPKPSVQNQVTAKDTIKAKGPAAIVSCLHPHIGEQDMMKTTRNLKVPSSWEIEEIKNRLQKKLMMIDSSIDGRGHSYSKMTDYEYHPSSSSKCHLGGDRGTTPVPVSYSHSLHASHRGAKHEKKACPRCGRWNKYDSKSVSCLVCRSCGKKFRAHKESSDKTSSWIKNINSTRTMSIPTRLALEM